MTRTIADHCRCRGSLIPLWEAEEDLQFVCFQRIDRMIAWLGSSGGMWSFAFRSPLAGVGEYLIIHAVDWADGCSQMDRITARIGAVLV